MVKFESMRASSHICRRCWVGGSAKFDETVLSIRVCTDWPGLEEDTWLVDWAEMPYKFCFSIEYSINEQVFMKCLPDGNEYEASQGYHRSHLTKWIMNIAYRYIIFVYMWESSRGSNKEQVFNAMIFPVVCLPYTYILIYIYIRVYVFILLNIHHMYVC